MDLGFGGEVADLYHRYRHGYPSAAIDMLAETFGLNAQDMVVDAGCGTGRLIVAVDHPFVIYALERVAGHNPNYHATFNWTEEWTMGGQTIPMSFWSRPLHAMTDAFTAAGFRISVISEPQPVPEARELFPEEFRQLSTGMSFLFFVLQAE